MVTVWFIRIEGTLLMIVLALWVPISRDLLLRVATAVACLCDPVFKGARWEVVKSIWTGRLGDLDLKQLARESAKELRKQGMWWVW
jgi:hypothetical protein